MTPPRLARRILERCAAPEERPGLLLEMDAEFARLLETTGAAGARRWYRGQVSRSIGPLLAERVRKVVTRPRTSEGLAVDIRHGIRNVVRHKSVSAFVVGTLGVASAAALASVVVLHGVVLAPLPFPAPDRLINLWNTGPSLPANLRPVSFQDLEDWRSTSKSLEALSAFTPVSATLTERGEVRRLEGMRVGRDFDRVLGLTPRYGRLFNDADFQPGAEPVLVVTQAFWRREFGPEATLGDERLVLDGQSRRIVGVLPALATTYPTDPHDFWTPLMPRAGARWELSRATGWIDAVARLRPGVTLEEAQQELSATAQSLAAAYPESNRERVAMKVVSLRETIIGAARPALVLVASATLALLLVAFGNVLHLLVAHGLSRRTEFSVRQALGAGQARLKRQTYVEATVLSVLIIAVGLAIAPLLLRALHWLPDSAVPRRGEIGILPNAWPWALALLCATVFAIGWPMVRVVLRAPLSVDSGSARSTGTRSDRRTRSVLVAAQVGLSVLLILGGVLFMQTLNRLESVDLGFAPDDVLAMQVVPSRTAAPTSARTIAFYKDAMDRIGTVPGVTGVAASTSVPFVISGWSFSIQAHDDPGPARHLLRVAVASTEFFDTLGIRVIEGRLFSEEESRQGGDVTVVSRRVAQLLFGDVPATGKFIDYSGARRRIVGVVCDVRTRADAKADATMYLPWHNAGQRTQAMLIKTTGGTAVLESISRRIREIDPEATIAEAGLLSDRIGKTLAPQRFRASLLAGLSALAALLAVLGAYSVTAFAVASGRREQAIRLALGERVGEAQWRVVLAAVRPAALGVLAGLAVAWYARRFVDAFLFETSATQFGLLAVPAVVLALVAVAAFIPATRLSNLDPASVFRPDR